MKKIFMALSAVLMMASCVEEISVTSVTINPQTLNLQPGGRYLLSAVPSPADAATSDPEWSSSDTKVATVAPTGYVTAVAPGEAIISASISGVVGTCKVSVTDTEIEGISFKNGTTAAKAVRSDDVVTLEVEYSPANPTNKNVTWAASVENVVEIVPDATTPGKAELTFVGSGEVDVTATSEVSGKTATQKFVVLGAEKIYILPEAVYAAKEAVYSLNKKAYPSICNAEWTVNGVKKTGDDVSFSVDIAAPLDSLIENPDYKMDSTVKVSLTAEINGITVQEILDIPVKQFWLEIPLETLGRNCTPLFNKSCTMVYIQTRNLPHVDKRELVQVNLLTGEKKAVDLKMDKSKILTNNGGQFCVNPNNGDVYVCNNQAIYCFEENGLNLKWSWDVPGTNENSGAFVMQGCGPALSNDCSVLFVGTTTDIFYAINAETGEYLSDLPFTSQTLLPGPSTAEWNGEYYKGGMLWVEFAVYGNDQIVMHRNSGTYSVHRITFKDNTLAFVPQNNTKRPFWTSNSHAPKTTDITSPVIDKSQSYVYFGGASILTFYPLAASVYADANQYGERGFDMRFSGCISSEDDGNYLYSPCQDKGKIMRIDMFDQKTCGSIPTAKDLLNYSNVACDTKGRIYYAYRDGDDCVRICRASFNEDNEASVDVIAQCPYSPVLNDEGKTYQNYQACNNMGNGYYVVCAPNKEQVPTLYVRYLDVNRGEGWSGFGGDVCGTKNANIVWGNN